MDRVMNERRRVIRLLTFLDLTSALRGKETRGPAWGPPTPPYHPHPGSDNASHPVIPLLLFFCSIPPSSHLFLNPYQPDTKSHTAIRLSCAFHPVMLALKTYFSPLRTKENWLITHRRTCWVSLVNTITEATSVLRQLSGLWHAVTQESDQECEFSFSNWDEGGDANRLRISQPVFCFMNLTNRNVQLPRNWNM